MKPLLHAECSARKYGGKFEDYLPIHNFFDSTKSAMIDVRHRAVLHSAFGIFIVEKVFGEYITNSDGKKVSVRDIGEDHVMEDLHFIPSMETWLKAIPIQPWMMGKREKTGETRHIPMKETVVGPRFPNKPIIPTKDVVFD